MKPLMFNEVETDLPVLSPTFLVPFLAFSNDLWFYEYMINYILKVVVETGLNATRGTDKNA